MLLAYGTYRHALAETGISIRRETTFASTGLPLAIRERWQINGVLHADTPAEVTRAIEALVAAYAQPGQDAVLYLPDGATPSAHALRSRDTLGGVRVTRPPEFPQGTGAEYSTFRSYTLELEADLPVQREANVLVHWEETLSIRGGGPRWVYLATLAGPPVRQQVQESTPYRATQVGRAVGYRDYPSPAEPIWPHACHHEATTIERRTPRRMGSGPHAAETEFEVVWKYEFESIAPLVGRPTGM